MNSDAMQRSSSSGVITSLTLPDAQARLRQFTCTHDRPSLPDTPEEQETLRQALLLVAKHSEYQILGICAETFEQGYLALTSYSAALGCSIEFNLEPIPGVVYIKFNPKSGLHYVDTYQGEHRGVLVSCQSAYESGINEMYGHLPLNLFLV